MSTHAPTYDDATARPAGGSGGAQDEFTSAARLLEKTARETDQWRAEARSEAEAVVAEAREEAAALVAEARSEAAALVRDARQQAEQVREAAEKEAADKVNDARVEAYRVREETAGLRTRLDEEVAELQQVATEHREQLRRHLTDMLDRVESTPAAGQ